MLSMLCAHIRRDYAGSFNTTSICPTDMFVCDYEVAVAFQGLIKVSPVYQIDKIGFGTGAAWLSVPDIGKIMKT